MEQEIIVNNIPSYIIFNYIINKINIHPLEMIVLSAIKRLFMIVNQVKKQFKV